MKKDGCTFINDIGTVFQVPEEVETDNFDRIKQIIETPSKIIICHTGGKGDYQDRNTIGYDRYNGKLLWHCQRTFDFAKIYSEFKSTGTIIYLVGIKAIQGQPWVDQIFREQHHRWSKKNRSYCRYIICDDYPNNVPCRWIERTRYMGIPNQEMIIRDMYQRTPPEYQNFLSYWNLTDQKEQDTLIVLNLYDYYYELNINTGALQAVMFIPERYSK